jgi:hypothetical protein
MHPTDRGSVVEATSFLDRSVGRDCLALPTDLADRIHGQKDFRAVTMPIYFFGSNRK